MSYRTPCALFALLIFVPVLPAAEKVVAIVNGEAITLAEVDSAMVQFPSAAPISAVQQRQRRSEVLPILIDDLLVRQFLKQHGPGVDPAEVERQVAGLAASLKTQGKSLDEYLKESSLTMGRIRENFLRMLQLAKYVEAQVTDERLRAYFGANRDFFDKTTVRTSHIVIRVAPTASPEERQKAAQKLRSVRSDLEARKIDFSAAAKAYSQDPSAAAGGDIGYTVRKFQVDEPYARAAFALNVGEVSDVVETESGYDLIWVTDRKPGKPTRYEEAVSDVRDCYEAELKQNLLADLRKKARIEIKLKE